MCNYNKNFPPFFPLVSRRRRKRENFFQKLLLCPLQSLFIIVRFSRVDNPSPTRKFPTMNKIIDKFTIREHLPQAFLFHSRIQMRCFFSHCSLLLFLFIISFIGHVPPRFSAHISSR